MTTTQTQTKWFPQFKQGNQWIFSQPVKPQYGFATIEECEQAITAIEELAVEEGVEPAEFRIVEAKLENE